MCLIGSLKSHLFHSFAGWFAREVARPGVVHLGLQTEPQLGVDVDTEVELGHRPSYGGEESSLFCT